MNHPPTANQLAHISMQIHKQITSPERKLLYLEEEVHERSVVDEDDVASCDAFLLVLVQFVLEDVLIEEQLELFIGHVDAQLLETVVLEILEAIDIQNSDPVVRLLSINRI